jgi:decaprenyl-phosphate phosphoribosyltransferase
VSVNSLNALVAEARPKQWVKNVLVFSAPGALGVLNESEPLIRALGVFVAFSLAASGVYFWNDIRDVELDRLHPTKRNRPIAAGSVSLGLARVVGTLLVVGGPALAFAIDADAGAILLLYVLIQAAYSGTLKNVPVLDLAIVSSGFVLRAMAGAAGTQTPMSNWFVLCTTFGSFFIVTGKRFAELAEMGDAASSTRASLRRYTTSYLDQLLVVSCTATVVTYCMWALESADAVESGLPLHGLTIVPMVMALFRYLMVLHEGRGGAPEEVFLGDRALQAYGGAWLALYGLAVYVN